MIADAANTVYVSAVSAWEIATKNRLGKWPGVERIVDEFPALLRRSRFAPLPLSIEHARLAGTLNGAHRDPFDRMLIAQSKEENAALVSCDAVFGDYAVELIWA
jgi:PIN domain nuclease of toxin-antitoxin system